MISYVIFLISYVIFSKWQEIFKITQEIMPVSQQIIFILQEIMPVSQAFFLNTCVPKIFSHKEGTGLCVKLSFLRTKITAPLRRFPPQRA
jgi:hypothetical protein